MIADSCVIDFGRGPVEAMPIEKLPDEIVLYIFWFLDIPDLYNASRVGCNLDRCKPSVNNCSNNYRRHITCEYSHLSKSTGHYLAEMPAHYISCILQPITAPA